MDKKTTILIVGPVILTVAIMAVLLNEADVVVGNHEEDAPLIGLDPFIFEPLEDFGDLFVSLKDPVGVGCGSRADRGIVPRFMNPLRPEFKPGCV